MATDRFDHGPRSLTRALAWGPVRRSSTPATRRRLRILAYHDVSDPRTFGAHVEELARHWHPVSGDDVVSALDGGARLPERAVWITFDDGRPGVVDAGLDVLERWAVPATMYVCPGVIESRQPYWWQQVEARPHLTVEVGGRTRAARDLVGALKQVDDDRRRMVVAELAVEPPTRPLPAQLDRPQLRRWVASGREVGNHTWDHPLLDRCRPEQQEEQIDRAHQWLAAELGRAPTTFAYPNGDRTDAAAAHLARRGYRSAPVFDHRLVARRPDPLALSRLRIDADAPPARLNAILSGAHSGLYGVARRPAAVVAGASGRRRPREGRGWP